MLHKLLSKFRITPPAPPVSEQALSAPRSTRWAALAKRFLAAHPRCELCGAKAGLIVHHVQPFHMFPELELVEANLIVLCEGGTKALNCHLWFGHLGDFKLWNPSVREDVSLWRDKKAQAIRESRAALKSISKSPSVDATAPKS